MVRNAEKVGKPGFSEVANTKVETAALNLAQSERSAMEKDWRRALTPCCISPSSSICLLDSVHLQNSRNWLVRSFTQSRAV